MKVKGIYAPKYYAEFECIKDKCRHSCCIGWEIDVDPETLKKYSSLKGETGEIIRDSITTDAAARFKLAGNRCPHLNNQNLCKIILLLGKDYLCDICRLHPRFFNETSRGTEVGLGASCEEACRIILSSDDYLSFIKIGDKRVEEVDFDAPVFRDKVYSILSRKDTPYTARLKEIRDVFSICPSLISDSDWRKIIASLEYLNESHKELFLTYSSSLRTEGEEKSLERALAYFIYRHASCAKSYAEFRTALTFALFCERLLASTLRSLKNTESGGAEEILRIISEEIEYSIDNTDTLMAEIEFALQ